MAPPPIKVRGAGRSKGIPKGYILGRTSQGTGDVELLGLGNLRAMGVATRQDVASIQLPFIQLTDVPQTYAGAGLKTIRVNAGATGLEFVTQNAITSTTLVVTGAGTAAVNIELSASIGFQLPLSSGDLTTPALVFGNGNAIGVAVSSPQLNTSLLSYLAVGLLASRPINPGVTAGATSGYLASDTGKFFVWTGAAWAQTN